MSLLIIIMMLLPIDGGVLIDALPCESELSYNGLPRCGKYPGDAPDIGAWEWFPGVTAENPKGFWTGVPLTYDPTKKLPAPKNLNTVDE